jgi:2,4-dienoyl-CoA reductase-like NADH-dependent reductase (Old Yellow Enzyme family)
MSALFAPLTVKHLTLPNRVAMPPMVSGGFTERGDTGGTVSAPVVEHYARRAQAGTALIIVEATAVDEGGRCWPTGLGAWSDPRPAPAGRGHSWGRSGRRHSTRARRPAGQRATLPARTGRPQ